MLTPMLAGTVTIGLLPDVSRKRSELPCEVPLFCACRVALYDAHVTGITAGRIDM